MPPAQCCGAGPPAWPTSGPTQRALRNKMFPAPAHCEAPCDVPHPPLPPPAAPWGLAVPHSSGGLHRRELGSKKQHPVCRTPHVGWGPQRMLFAGVRVEWGPCGVEGMCGVGGSARPCEHPGRAVCPKVAPTSTLPLGLSTHGRTHLGACQELGEEIPPISGHPRNQGRLGGGPHLWDTTGWGLHCGTHKGGGPHLQDTPLCGSLSVGCPWVGVPTVVPTWVRVPFETMAVPE